MLKFLPPIFKFSFLFVSLSASIFAEGSPQQKEASPSMSTPFTPFTGKISKNKVRLRLAPSYEGQILKELQKNDLFIVLGETDDFFAVQPPKELKGYVFRTYVLDNVVEGSHVNVRAQPDLDAPVLAQLNQGDSIEGIVDPANNKWLQIRLPSSTRLYIAKEYVEKIGDQQLLTRLEKKKEEAAHLLNETLAAHRNEMAKPFDQMHIDGVVKNYQQLISSYPEFPEFESKAKEELDAIQGAFNQKRLSYLESQAENNSQVVESNRKLVAELQAQKNKVASLQQQINATKQPAEASGPSTHRVEQLPLNIAVWIPVEEALYERWKDKQDDGSDTSMDQFYEDQKNEAFIVRGVIDPYNRPVKNRPGDYLLINSTSKLPFAFLYSTKINLQDLIGHEVSLIVLPRKNNNFAFPAYYVLSVE